MPRLQGETDQQYKQRVLDPKSSSFCGAKWYNATIWLGSGMTTSCHHPLPHKVSVEEVMANPKALHNTKEKKEQRRQMQCGERPAGCEYCWKIEDIGRNNISDRVYKSVIYSDEDLEHAHKLDHNEDVNLQTLEIAFDRTCNFACSYCNPAFSSTWVKDIKSNGPYERLTSDGRNHFTHPHDSSQLYKFGEPNPYVEAFFKWWESDLHKTLQELRVTGGEPMMSADMWRLFDWFAENKGRSNTRLAINSNLGGKLELIKKLIEKSHSIDHLHLYTSCEATFEQADYIRDGMNYSDWYKNIANILTDANLEGFHMMCTVNALCLFSITDFLDKMMFLKKSYGKDYPTFTLNILRFPSFQSPLVLPEHILKDRKQQIEKWYMTVKDSELLHEMERNQIERLIDYLDVVKSPHANAFPREKLEKDFKQFYQQYDRRRGKDFAKTFPQLKEWYNEI
jgi:organic radical activating enzyme